MLQASRPYIPELTVFVLFLWARVECAILSLALVLNSSIILVYASNFFIAFHHSC